MPTKVEQEELLNNCTWTWTTQNGYNVVGPNGNSIFLHAAGNRYGSSLNAAGSYGGYWSSAPYGSYYVISACSLNFNSDGQCMGYYTRGRGLSVRPVVE